jgi:hypothetical protein
VANQFTSGGGSKGPKKHHDQATRDKIRAELLAKRLYKFANAKGEKAKKYSMDSAQVAAAKVLIDKGKPSLQAVEQTEVNQWDKMSEEEMLGMVQALITSHPELIQKLNLQAKPVQVEPRESESAA